MFTERELQLILNELEFNYGGLAAEIERQIELGHDVASMNVECEELKALIDKVHDLFLEA